MICRYVIDIGPTKAQDFKISLPCSLPKLSELVAFCTLLTIPRVSEFSAAWAARGYQGLAIRCQAAMQAPQTHMLR